MSRSAHPVALGTNTSMRKKQDLKKGEYMYFNNSLFFALHSLGIGTIEYQHNKGKYGY